MKLKPTLSITAFHDYTARSRLRAAPFTTYHEQNKVPQHVFIVTVMEHTP